MKKKKIVLGAAFAVMSSLMVAAPVSAAHLSTKEGCKENKAMIKESTADPYKNQGQCIKAVNTGS